MSTCIAYTAGKIRPFRVRSAVGDHVEMTPYDPEKGRSSFASAHPIAAGRRSAAGAAAPSSNHAYIDVQRVYYEFSS